MSKFHLNIVVITNGKSEHFRTCLSAWSSGAGLEIGRTVFFCGPEDVLSRQGVPHDAIIPFADEPGSGANFPINAKKLAACNAVSAEYVYLVHDRFVPAPSFFPAVSDALSQGDIAFGAVDVFNPDGSLALGELRLKRGLLGEPRDSVLSRRGRLIVSHSDPRSSNQVAINGGQFFIKREMLPHLQVPLRWGEMEDDVLSFDLGGTVGCWLKATHLTTLVHRNPPIFKESHLTSLKYALYSGVCTLIAKISRACGNRRHVLGVGESINADDLMASFQNGVILIDPMHKTFASDYLVSTREKLMVRARLLSGGGRWHRITRTRLGWLFH